YLSRLRPLEPEGEGLVCDVIQRHVIRDDVAIQMLAQALARSGAGVEKKVIFEAENERIRENPALSIQEKAIYALAGLHALNVVGAHGVQQPRPVLSGNAYSPALR